MDKCLERGFIKLKISKRRGVDGEDQGEEESENGQVLGDGFYKAEDIKKKRGFVCSL